MLFLLQQAARERRLLFGPKGRRGEEEEEEEGSSGNSRSRRAEGRGVGGTSQSCPHISLRTRNASGEHP